MKKLFLFLILLAVSLCGCSKVYYEPEQIVIISAIGIDYAEEGLLLTFETVDTSKPEGNWEYSTKTLETAELNCQRAYEHLQQSLGNELNTQHCVLVVIGKNVKKDVVFESLAFLSEEKSLSQNTKIVKCENANKLIKTKSYSGQAVGYDIVKILNLQSEKEINLKSNLYYVLKSKNEGNLQVPEILNENGKYFLREKNE